MSHHPPSQQWHSARELMQAAGAQYTRPTVVSLPLAQAIGSTLVHDVTSVLAVPHYDSSAMDGYAVAGAPPWQLVFPAYPADKTANIHKLTVELSSGLATPIFTGGLIPSGAESILRSEHSRLSEKDGVTFLEPLTQPPAPGADIRRTGEEREAGAILASAGTLLTARCAASLAVGGIDTVQVYKPVTVAVAFSGNEVITSGIPGPGQVRDAFYPFAEHLIKAFGAQVIATTRLADTAEAFAQWMSATDAQVLLVTGGSSTSGVDMVRSTLAALGGTYLFESVRIRPGHPALAAILPGGRVLLGLPGNPLATYTALCAYLPALLDGAYHRKLTVLPTAPLALAIPALRKKTPQIIPALWDSGTLRPLERAKSHMLGGFAAADVLVYVPAEGLAAQEDATYIPLH